MHVHPNRRVGVGRRLDALGQQLNDLDVPLAEQQTRLVGRDRADHAVVTRVFRFILRGHVVGIADEAGLSEIAEHLKILGDVLIAIGVDVITDLHVVGVRRRRRGRGVSRPGQCRHGAQQHSAQHGSDS